MDRSKPKRIHSIAKKSQSEPVKVSIIPEHEAARIAGFEEDKPYSILGPHLVPPGPGVSIRAFLPRAVRAWIRIPGRRGIQSMTKIHPRGFYEIYLADAPALFPYKIGFKDATGFSQEFQDPYAFPVGISDYDLYLMNEGTHMRSYEKFGAHPSVVQEVSGVHFALWAPNAKSVSVIGNFNHWVVGAHPMTRLNNSGIWGLFVPGLAEGELYKYAIRSAVDNGIRVKTDPYAFQAELRPHTAAVVARLDHYSWNDRNWLEQRKQKNVFESAVSIYEVHLGSWKRDGEKGWGFMNYRDLAHQLVDFVKSMGYTHIELMPVMEHPLDASWGYQVINYFAPTSRFGKPEDFMYFVDYCHCNDVGVILDWVPAHFPKDGHGLVDFDGRQIYAYESWRKAEHKEWGTLVFDYGRREVKNFLIANALFWLDRYHVDGLRVDAVASMLYLDYARKPGEWEPNQYGGRENLEALHFLKWFNEVVHAQYPGVLTLAEESTAWPGVSRPTSMGGLGFDMKWNMGWMHDTLEYFSKDPVYRKHHQGMLTFSMLYAFSENFILPISHDEVVYGKKSLLEKMPGDDWQQFSNLLLFLTYLYAHPGKKLLFMGTDFAQRREWNFEQSLDWHLWQYARHYRVSILLRDLHRLYKENRAFHEGDFRSDCFEWIDFSDADSSIISFLRWSNDRRQLLVFVFNMTPVIRENYRIGVPWGGDFQEIFNSQAREYGGCGLGNQGGIHADIIAWHGRPCSLNCHLPPLGAIIFRCGV